MPFNAATAVDMYRRFLGPLAQPVMLAIQSGNAFVEYPEITAYVTAYRESDLVPGGSIQLGDLRFIILVADLPSAITEMGRNDRIVVDNLAYSVVHWDEFTREVGDTGVAIEAAGRGGAVYV
jgi:hypothetical protein